MIPAPVQPVPGAAYMPLSDVHMAVPNDGPSPDATPGVTVHISETTVVQDNNAPPTVYYFVTFVVEYAIPWRFINRLAHVSCSGAEYDLAMDCAQFQFLHNRLAMALGQQAIPAFPEAVR